jgi:hypothetical protein
MSRGQTVRAVVSVSKTYRCPFCIKDAILSSSFGTHTLKLFRSCRKHRADMLNKECPCGSPWADCLPCKDDGIDPRAGSAYCPDCRRRYGRSTDGRLCRCRQRLAAASTLPRAATATPGHELALAAVAAAADSDEACSGDGTCAGDADGDGTCAGDADGDDMRAGDADGDDTCAGDADGADSSWSSDDTAVGDDARLSAEASDAYLDGLSEL